MTLVEKEIKRILNEVNEKYPLLTCKNCKYSKKKENIKYSHEENDYECHGSGYSTYRLVNGNMEKCYWFEIKEMESEG